MMSIIALWKYLLLGGLIVVIAIAESHRPFASANARWTHVVRNSALAVINTAALGGLYVVVITLASEYSLALLPVNQLPAWLAWPLALLILDVALYWWHRLNHQWSWLWRFHRVHHLDAALDFSSGYRFHLGELLLSMVYKSLLLLLVDITVWQVLIFDIAVLAFAMFNHGNMRVPREQWIRTVIVTPAMHRVHHQTTRRLHDSNYCTTISLWDRVFGSYIAPTTVNTTDIGLGAPPQQLRLLSLLTAPFRRY